MNLPGEDKLLEYCATIYSVGKTKNRLKELLHNNLNWPYILQESINQAIACLVRHNLLEFKELVPQNIWKQFEEIYYATASRNIKIYREINIVLLSFNKENLKIIPLKGIFLAENVYKNIALRPMTDVDILIKKDGLPKIDKVLEGLGYKTSVNKKLASDAMKKSYMNSLDYFKPDKKSISLHIHWHIVNVSMPTYMYSKNIKMDRFWECAEPVYVANVQTLGLMPHHLIMYLSEHALKHSFDRLILLSDIDSVVKKYAREIDWKELIQETRNFGMEKQVYYSLYVTNYFLGTVMPDYVLSSLKPEKINFLERKFFNSVINNNRNTKLCYFVYLNMVKGVINKIIFIFRTLFPPPSILPLVFNLSGQSVTVKDYLLFLKKQFCHLLSLRKI